MATIGLATQPFVSGDAIAHKDFSIRWEDSVGTDGEPHAGHYDRIVIKDDADRVVVDEWAKAAATPDGGTVEVEFKIEHPGLREGLHTVTVEVDADDKPASAVGECIIPVTFDGAGVAREGQEFALTLREPFIVESMADPSAIEPVAGHKFVIVVGVDNQGPDTSPGAHQTSCSIAGSGGSWQDDLPQPVDAVAVGTGQLAQFHCPGLPAGVYRADIWVDLVTTMQPVGTTFDFTVKEADGS